MAPASTTPDPQGATEVAATVAMDRVLRAEREAIAALSECERHSTADLERARQQRRTILERMQARIVALHSRAAQALERRAADILEKHLHSSTAEVEQLADPGMAAFATESKRIEAAYSCCRTRSSGGSNHDMRSPSGAHRGGAAGAPAMSAGTSAPLSRAADSRVSRS